MHQRAHSQLRRNHHNCKTELRVGQKVLLRYEAKLSTTTALGKLTTNVVPLPTALSS